MDSKFNKLFNTIMEDVNKNNKKNIILEFAPSKYKPLNPQYMRSHLNNSGYWWNVSQNYNLTQDLAREFAEHINWDLVAKYNTKFPWTPEFIVEMAPYISGEESLWENCSWFNFCQGFEIPDEWWPSLIGAGCKLCYLLGGQAYLSFDKPRKYKYMRDKLPALLEKYWSKLSPTEELDVANSLYFGNTGRAYVLKEFALANSITKEFIEKHKDEFTKEERKYIA